jgi:hypothetical protein
LSESEFAGSLEVKEIRLWSLYQGERLLCPPGARGAAAWALYDLGAVPPIVRRVLRPPDREAQRVEWARFTRRWYCLILAISAAALALMAASSPAWWVWAIAGVSALFAVRRIVRLTLWLRRESEAS